MTDQLNLDNVQVPFHSPPAGNYTVRHWRIAYTRLRERFVTLLSRARYEEKRAQLAEARAKTAESELAKRDAQHDHLQEIMPRMQAVLGQLQQQFAIEPTPDTIVYDASRDGEGATCIMVADGEWQFVIDGDAEETRAYHSQLLNGRFAIRHQSYGLDRTALMALVRIRETIDGKPNTGTTPKAIIDQIYAARGSFALPTRAAHINPAVLKLFSDSLWGKSHTHRQDANG